MDKKVTLSKLFYSLIIKNFYLFLLSLVLFILGYWITLLFILGLLVLLIDIIISIIYALEINKVEEIEEKVIEIDTKEINSKEINSDFIDNIYKICEDKINELEDDKSLSFMARNLKSKINSNLSFIEIVNLLISECIIVKSGDDIFILKIKISNLKIDSINLIFKFKLYDDVKELSLKLIIDRIPISNEKESTDNTNKEIEFNDINELMKLLEINKLIDIINIIKITDFVIDEKSIKETSY